MPDGTGDLPKPEPENVLAEVAKFVEACRKTVVKRGQRGAVVEFLQTQLSSKGYDLTSDGAFGPQTLKSVKLFQASNGLTVDGVVGPATWTALLG
jgi:peptidoglycan hydrolase-like protein with peptidoglycan-binding domain